MRRLLVPALVLSLPLAASAGGPQEEPPDINFDFKVTKAIEKGISWLKGKRTGSYHKDIENGNELILLTYLHSGVVKDDDADLQALLKYILESKLERTYKVALTAMCLEEIDRVKYQGRLHQCGQFLADNVSAKGESRYGEPSIFVEDIKPVPTGAPRPQVRTEGTRPISNRPPPEPGRREKPEVKNTIDVKQKREGPADHDHSNMQYHALGLRACHDGGIRFEAKLLERIDAWWRKAQKDDKNAKKEPLTLDPPKGKKPAAPGSTQAAVTENVAPQGWSYTDSDKDAHGSMSVGAVGALCILDYMRGKDWRKDTDVLEGMQWINKNFSVTENPFYAQKWYYYYLYGLERAGMLFGTETIGSHKWYREGAEVLLKAQGGDGKWAGGVEDTCFAILFLRRATRRLDVITGR